jgi:hypothetical protein
VAGGGPRTVGAAPAAAAPMSIAPLGITGAGVTVAASADWVSATFEPRRLASVRAWVDKFLGTSERSEKGLRWYPKTFRWEMKAVLAYGETVDTCWLSVNGDSLAHIGGKKIMRFLHGLAKRGASFTRFDVAIDDYSGKLLKMDLFEQAVKDGNVVGCKRYQHEKITKNLKTGELEGESHNFGRRGGDGSGRYVRCYNKNLESKGKVPVIRFEVEFSGEVARMVIDGLLDCKNLFSFTQKMARAAVGSVDFKERAGKKHIARMARLPWYQRIIDAAGGCVRYVAKQVIPPLQETMEYAKTGWFPTLALAADIIDDGGHDGESVLLGMIRQARAWMRRRQGARDLGLDLSRLLCGGVALVGGPPQADACD